MSDEAPSIRVNFGRPIPLFPLDGVSLLPHAVLPLHIFEPRYRQMIEDTLDGQRLIAMAVFEGDRWRQEYHGRPPLKPAVCVAHILQEERLPDGRFNILVQGVCRARIDEELTSREQRAIRSDAMSGEDPLYREARLVPVGLPGEEDSRMSSHRDSLKGLLRSAPLRRFTDAQGSPLGEGLAAYLDHPAQKIPTSVVADLVGHLMIREPRVKYSLLEEGDASERAKIVEIELGHLASLIRRADLQVDPKAPRGVHWN